MDWAGRPAKSMLLDEILLVAASHDPAERDAYLQAVALFDAELAATVRHRLGAANALSDSFLDTPAATRLGVEQSAGDVTSSGASVAGAASADVVPAVLPASERYEIGVCLGEGGMGRVHEAVDRQLGRRVALKFLAHEDPEIARCFLREARAQARVQHDHVLEIYDSGELDEQPFIAMRCVDGGTLAEVGPTLSLEHKVRLLVQVANGLHAAHREGLLHRDVKPSNILVDQRHDGALRALVTDFGLATELDGTESTLTEAIAGSPHYIAPERLQRPPTSVDRRSDIYSLGVTVYWLLTGDVPFSGEQTVDILRQSAHAELPRPRTRMPGLPAELEAIILRCVARDPGERYASARAVAVDLQRYLDGEVVESYAASLSYRLTRFVLRNRLLVGMAALAFAALVVASVAVAIFALRADQARARAEMRQGQAEELLRFVVVDLREKLASLGRLDVLDDVGGAAMEYFAAVPPHELSEAELMRRSRMLYQIGEVRIQQGNLDGAEAPMEESLALARRLAELEPDDGDRLFELGQSHFWVGFVRWERGDLVAARESFVMYLEISRRLVAMDGQNRTWRRELSYAHSNLGSLLEAEGDLPNALEQFRATLAIDQDLVEAVPEDSTARSELAASHNTVGVVLQALGRLDEADHHLRADLAIRRTLASANPESFDARERLGASHGHLGTFLYLRGKLAPAHAQFEQMRAITEELVSHDPANTTWRYQFAWSHFGLGRVAFARGQTELARAAWQRQSELIEALLTLDPTPHRWRRTRATSLLHLALLERARSVEEARESAQTAIDGLEPLAAARPTDRQVHRWLARSHLLVGSLESSPAAATAAFARAAEVMEPFVHDARDGRVLAPWAEALHCLGRSKESRVVVERLQQQGFQEPVAGMFCGASRLSMSSFSTDSRQQQ